MPDMHLPIIISGAEFSTAKMARAYALQVYIVNEINYDPGEIVVMLTDTKPSGINMRKPFPRPIKPKRNVRVVKA